MKTMLKVVLVVGGAILAGCAENTNGQTIPVSLKPDANLAVIKSYRETPILTTFGRKLTSEIADGVKCTLENDDFSAKVITPAKVSLPIYDKKPSSLSVKCEGFNERRFLLIHPGIEGRVVGGPGLVGVAVGAATAAAVAARDDWGYPKVIWVDFAKRAE